jgi:hypothetical protein
VTITYGRARGRLVPRVVDDFFSRLFVPRSVRKSCDTIEGIIREELASGKVAETGDSSVVEAEPVAAGPDRTE